jgi:LmbE family N-acetylglucosaminyl deacetylase
MNIPADLQALAPCDSLYVSPHHDDALLSCGARLLAEAARGLRIVVVTVFGDSGREWPAVGALATANVRRIALGLPDARRRSDYYSTFQALVEGRRADDDRWVKQLASVLTDVGHRSKASQVYVPLGVGSHIDHRLAHEACLRGFQSGDGRNVFLYEERPEAFVRGAVRVRLGQLGARLPPAAAQAADRARLAPFLWRFHLAPSLRGDIRGWPERLRSTGLAARQWRQGRQWHPQKGFGPRLQPVVHPTDGAQLESVRALLQAALAPSGGRAASRVARLSAAYARRLGAVEHAERFWLLLPPREEGGITTVADADELLPARAG